MIKSCEPGWVHIVPEELDERVSNNTNQAMNKYPEEKMEKKAQKDNNPKLNEDIRIFPFDFNFFFFFISKRF